MIDFADIPSLVSDDFGTSSTLGFQVVQIDVDLAYTIRKLHNYIKRRYRGSDCTREDADAVAALCIHILEFYGFSDAAEDIRERERLEQEQKRREVERKGRQRRAQELSRRLSAGGYHSLGLREDGTVVGWGSNSYGECTAPAGKFVAVAAGRYRSLGLREDGTVVGWGVAS